jgi:hypothetical protein
MSTWTTISNAAVAVGGIPSSSTVTALRDNPVAIAGAATGAPVVVAGWHPVDKTNVGDGAAGLIYDNAVNGNVAEVVTPDFEDGYEYRLIGTQLTHSIAPPASRTLSIQAFRQTAASYVTAYTTATSVNTTTFFHIDAEFVFPRLALQTHLIRVMATNGLSLDGNANGAFATSTEKILRAKFLFSSGNVASGKIYMFRRREYASGP